MTEFTSFPIKLGSAQSPNEGPRFIPLSFAIAYSQHDTNITRVVNASDSGMASIQSIEIDNSDNNAPLNISISETNQTIYIPAYTILISPVYAQGLSVTLVLRWQWNQYPFPYQPPIYCRLFNFSQPFSKKTSLDLDTTYGGNWKAPIVSDVAVPTDTWTRVLSAAYRSRFIISYDPSAPTGEQWLVGFSNQTGSNMPTSGINVTSNQYQETQTHADIPITHTAIWIRQSSGATRKLSILWWNV